MTMTAGGLNLQSLATTGCLFEMRDGGPATELPVVRGQRVLIPGRTGLYTPVGAFEDDHLIVRIHGVVMGAGSSHDDRVTSFHSRMTALYTAIDAADREDVTLTYDGYTIDAALVRIEGPSPATWLNEAWEIDVEFIATDPPAWSASGS